MRYSQMIEYVILKEGLERRRVFSESRKQEYCECRYICWSLARELTELPFSKIGLPFDRSHADVMSGIKKFADIRFTEKDKQLKYEKYMEYFVECLRTETNPVKPRTYRLRPYYRHFRNRT